MHRHAFLTSWLLMQSVYQIFWMLLILFGAPAVFDRYSIRSECEAFTEGHSDNSGSFCSHKDVTKLSMATGFDNTEVCETAVFPIAAGSTCPSFEDPTAESVSAAVIGGSTCSGEICDQLLQDAQAVCHPASMRVPSLSLHL